LDLLLLNLWVCIYNNLELIVCIIIYIIVFTPFLLKLYFDFYKKDILLSFNTFNIFKKLFSLVLSLFFKIKNIHISLFKLFFKFKQLPNFFFNLFYKYFFYRWLNARLIFRYGTIWERLRLLVEFTILTISFFVFLGWLDRYLFSKYVMIYARFKGD